jgi:mannosyl-oligosaccharide alpha-1,2-mannosidase
MYLFATQSVIQHLLFKSMLPDEKDVLMASKANSAERCTSILEPRMEHLRHFAGGMFALGSKILGIEEHVEIGRKLTDGCV